MLKLLCLGDVVGTEGVAEEVEEGCTLCLEVMELEDVLVGELLSVQLVDLRRTEFGTIIQFIRIILPCTVFQIIINSKSNSGIIISRFKLTGT